MLKGCWRISEIIVCDFVLKQEFTDRSTIEADEQLTGRYLEMTRRSYLSRMRAEDPSFDEEVQGRRWDKWFRTQPAESDCPRSGLPQA